MTEPVTITREDGESKGRYIARIAGVDEFGELTYSKAGASRIIIDHTGVPESLNGKGVGAALVRKAVEDARAEKKIILPLCPFAKAYIERHPELQDVLT